MHRHSVRQQSASTEHIVVNGFKPAVSHPLECSNPFARSCSRPLSIILNPLGASRVSLRIKWSGSRKQSLIRLISKMGKIVHRSRRTVIGRIQAIREDYARCCEENGSSMVSAMYPCGIWASTSLGRACMNLAWAWMLLVLCSTRGA
jgi:hypothetical protein